jgi:DNA-directed RNA polymerase specialized sigma24 family protein
MGSKPNFPQHEYWYLGRSPRDAGESFHEACGLAWPYASYCAIRFLHDSHAAYDLMDAAVENTERYYERFDGDRTSKQLVYRLLSVLKRLSLQWSRRQREVPCGTLSDLESVMAEWSERPDIEQAIFASQLLARLSDQSRMIALWRLQGHTWRHIAKALNVNHTTLQRNYRKELRGLLCEFSDRSKEQEDADQE